MQQDFLENRLAARQRQAAEFMGGVHRQNYGISRHPLFTR